MYIYVTYLKKKKHVLENKWEQRSKCYYVRKRRGGDYKVLLKSGTKQEEKERLKKRRKREIIYEREREREREIC